MKSFELEIYNICLNNISILFCYHGFCAIMKYGTSSSHFFFLFWLCIWFFWVSYFLCFVFLFKKMIIFPFKVIIIPCHRPTMKFQWNIRRSTRLFLEFLFYEENKKCQSIRPLNKLFQRRHDTFHFLIFFFCSSIILLDACVCNIF